MPQLITTAIGSSRLPLGLPGLTDPRHWEAFMETGDLDMASFPWPSPLLGFPSPTVRLILRSRGQKRELRPGSGCLTVGRDPHNDFVIPGTEVSRIEHIRCDIRDGWVLLWDRSTNGSYVLDDSGQETFLHRERMPLSGSGRISLGCPLEQASQVIHYRVEG
ncbi:MAG: FHA domain-containing protein [Magnetococcales bacterium]|nr:FHA domain-containing protein [Magnetococcales bacterium]